MLRELVIRGVTSDLSTSTSVITYDNCREEVCIMCDDSIVNSKVLLVIFVCSVMHYAFACNR